jgi:hypothetical protein
MTPSLFLGDVDDRRLQLRSPQRPDRDINTGPIGAIKTEYNIPCLVDTWNIHF